MSDKYGFKNAFLAMAGVQALTLGLYDKLAASKLSFALGTMSVYFTLGGGFMFCIFGVGVSARRERDPHTHAHILAPGHNPATGAFAMFPPFISKRFGARNGVAIYSYIFTAFALASILGCVRACAVAL